MRQNRRSGLRGHERSRMAEPEVEAAWRAEFERSGAAQLREALNSGAGFTDELNRRRQSSDLCSVSLPIDS